jgi:hypothetical protein
LHAPPPPIPYVMPSWQVQVGDAAGPPQPVAGSHAKGSALGQPLEEASEAPASDGLDELEHANVAR